MEKKLSHTLQLSNAYITLHDHDDGSAILNVSSVNSDAYIGVLVTLDELRDLAMAIAGFTGSPRGENDADTNRYDNSSGAAQPDIAPTATD